MCFIAAGYAIVRTSRRVSSTLSQVQCVVDVRREEKYGREVENSLDLYHRHLGDNAQLVVIKKAGHAFGVEKASEFFSILKSYLLDFQLPSDL
ncbi:hypothetical protein ACSQ67_024438 [Phaseolus vulgaris]